MLFCEISLNYKVGQPKEYNEDVIWEFLNSLNNNGQILKGYKVVKNENFLLYVSLPKPDSLEIKHDSPYVKRDREKLEQFFDIFVRIIGVDAASGGYCECVQRNAIEMQTTAYDIDSVFTCCRCGKPIALYELPLPEFEGDYGKIRWWQDNFSAMDMLWMNCLCDRYTGRQLTECSSALNRQGRELAANMGKKLGCKVYYNMFDDLVAGSRKPKWRKEGEKFRRVCPECGKLMIHFGNDNFEMEYCDDCNLSSNVYKE